MPDHHFESAFHKFNCRLLFPLVNLVCAALSFILLTFKPPRSTKEYFLSLMLSLLLALLVEGGKVGNQVEFGLGSINDISMYDLCICMFFQNCDKPNFC